MPDCTRRGFIAATPALACLTIGASAAPEPEPDDIRAKVEGRAVSLLDALNLLGDGAWVMKAGMDGDVLIFHRKLHT